MTVYPKDIHFEGFPEGDGFWWVRWVECEAMKGTTTRSPMLCLTISEIPGFQRFDDLPSLQEVLAAEAGRARTVLGDSTEDARYRRVRLDAGWTPLMKIGLVLHRGHVAGSLEMSRRRMVLGGMHEAVVGLRRWRRDGEVSMSRSNGPRHVPGTGAFGDPFYPLPSQVGGCIVAMFAKDNGKIRDHMVIPCAETFRALYAPHRILALALLAGPWDETAKTVLDPDKSRSMVGAWELALRPGVPASLAATIGNLLLGPQGRKSASRVWVSILGSRGDVVELEAPIPFEWKFLEIEVSGISGITGPKDDRHPVFMALRIEAVRWPDPPEGPPGEIRVFRSSRTEPDPGSESDPLSGVVVKPYFPGGSGHVEQGADPDDGVGVDVLVGGVEWGNGPSITIVEADRSGPGERHSVSSEPNSSLSAGVGRSSGQGPVKAQVDATGEDPSPVDLRWERVLSVLDALVKSKEIVGYSIPMPPSDLSVTRGRFRAWAIPRIARFVDMGRHVEHWYNLAFGNKREGRRDIRRTALVVTVALRGGVVHWLELERRRRGHESFFSLVFRTPTHARPDMVVMTLLEFAAKHGGVWTGDEPIRDLRGSDGCALVARSALCRHLDDDDIRYRNLVAGCLRTLIDDC